MLTEINIDGLVGPTHHFGGLGVGNLASREHANGVSRPRAAALEGLRKAALLDSLGIPQFIWLPPVRPRLELLQAVGFKGDRHSQIEAAFHTAPHLLSAAFSGAFMWAANSATVSASCDTFDGYLHFTPANLISSWHRSVEAGERRGDLQVLFVDCPKVSIHHALPSLVPLRDEGAANHMRVSDPTGRYGFDLFVSGDGLCSAARPPDFFPRQSRAACEAIARRHQLAPERTVFLQQHPAAISAGVFHNDVIATSHRNFLIYHQYAFVEDEAIFDALEVRFRHTAGCLLLRVRVTEQELPLHDAVRSYFFNSQIVTPGSSYRDRNPPRMVLVCPAQCQEIESARRLIQRLIADPDNPLDAVHFVGLEQSMANGGGPACLRLRVPVTDEQVACLPERFRFSSRLHDQLTHSIETHYRETLELKDFLDCEFVDELRASRSRWF